MRQDGQTRIDEAERLVKQITQKTLAKEQQETLSTIQSLLAKAKEALSNQDLPKAVNLGEKAKVLADDLLKALK